eukprot:SAG31_NODE_1772_length_7306_cov_3.341335_2_plen_191_part_00
MSSLSAICFLPKVSSDSSSGSCRRCLGSHVSTTGTQMWSTTLSTLPSGHGACGTTRSLPATTICETTKAATYTAAAGGATTLVYMRRVVMGSPGPNQSWTLESLTKVGLDSAATSRRRASAPLARLALCKRIYTQCRRMATPSCWTGALVFQRRSATKLWETTCHRTLSHKENQPWTLQIRVEFVPVLMH